MILCFRLSMPNNNSWDGKWSGEDNLYAIVKHFKGKLATAKAQVILDKSYFQHNFRDGWSARVTVKKVDAKEARRIRRLSQGFCGYDWMIDDIIEDLEIRD